jgi:Mg2+ and Co2+ transporter CorA
MQRQLELYSQSFDQIVTVATSMIQILDSRRSIREAINAKRLADIALVFVPLSWVASLFNMGGDFLPGKGLFWVYFAVGLPLVAVVLLISVCPLQGTAGFLN